MNYKNVILLVAWGMFLESFIPNSNYLSNHIVFCIIFLILSFLLIVEKMELFKNRYWCYLLEHAKESFNQNWRDNTVSIPIRCKRCQKTLFTFPAITQDMVKKYT